jgi:hypothetical protein
MPFFLKQENIYEIIVETGSKTYNMAVFPKLITNTKIIEEMKQFTRALPSL